MTFKKADAADFETAFYYIKNLWTYNTYNKEEIQEVYNEVITSDNSFAFFLLDDARYRGFCHGDYFNTFWMSGLTCYVSSLITNEEDRCMGYGTAMLNHARLIAKEKGCKAIILDSGIPREDAHTFYENYGFTKSCFGFELIL